MAKTETRPSLRTRPDKGDKKHSSWDGGRASVHEADMFLARETERRHELTSRLIDRQDERNRRPVTPWLLLRYNLTDRGFRPIPPPEPFWISPDISVQTNDPLGRPIAGQVNYVHARIHNLGAFAAAPVKVDFFWADPSLGLGAAHMHKIKEPADPLEGSVYLEIPSLHAVDVRSPVWVPLMLNNGHECLIVHCSNWAADPIRHPFQPVKDRHVGQRNMQVIPAPPGGLIQFSLKLNNLTMERSQTRIAARVRHLRLTRPLSDRADLRGAILNAALFMMAQPAPRQAVTVKMREAMHVTMNMRTAEKESANREEAQFRTVRAEYGAPYIATELGDRCRNIWLDQPENAGRQDTSGLCRPCQSEPKPAGGGLAVLRQLVLHGGEQRDVQFEVGIPEQAKLGDFVVYHIFQQDEIGVRGGYTVVALITG